MLIRPFLFALGIRIRHLPNHKLPLRLALATALILLVPAHSASAGAATSAPGSQLRAEDYRIAATAYRLATRGGRFCPQKWPITGLTLHHLAEYGRNDRSEAARVFGLDKGPGVLAVVEGSAAAVSGLAAGDVLLSVNGTAFPSPASAAHETDDTKRRRLIELADAQLERQLELGPIRLSLLRGDKQIELTVRPEQGCLARARLARSNQANAFADGRYAVMTTKMLGFVRSDDELAVALAHELAHNILNHPAELEQEKVPTGILRNFGKNAARVLATEEEADRLGIKLAWAAGYDVAAAIPFWRRLYAKYDPIPTPKLFRTHPSFGARERMIGETIAELKR